MHKDWRFLTARWWIVHFVGFSLMYTLGRVFRLMMGG
jgi:hypothetical protein